MRRLPGVWLCLSLIGLLAYSPGCAWADDLPDSPQTFANDRVALVIGQSDYSAFPLPSATADAALIAETLQQAGFDVESGVDLPEVAIGEQLAAFIDKVNLHGSNTTAVIYIAARFAQINGENLLLPIGARITRAADVAVSGFNIKKLLDALTSVPMRACVVMIDASAPPESLSGEKTFAPGLSIVDPPKRFLIAYSQNPGMALTEQDEKPGHFAKAFLIALQQPVANFPDLFKAIRVRISDDTGGLQRPWESNNLEDSTFSFFPSKEGDPPPPAVTDLTTETPVASLPHEEAYQKVIAIDTVQSYQSFIQAFPDDAALPNIQYNLAVRREAEVWAEALRLDTPEAYWTYIKTYPDGGNVPTAQARIAKQGSTVTQPDDFVVPAGFTEIPPPLDKGEIVASSASMPVAFLPQPPAMQLPPIAPYVVAAVAAAAALPVAMGVGRHAVPAIGHAPMHPAWAAPVAFSPNRLPGLSGLAPAGPGELRTGPASPRPEGGTMPVARNAVQPLNAPGAFSPGRVPAPLSMPSAAAGQPGVRPLNAPPAAPAVTPLAERTSPSSTRSVVFSPVTPVSGVSGGGARPEASPLPIAAGRASVPTQRLGQSGSAATTRPIGVPASTPSQTALVASPAARSPMGGLANAPPSALPRGNATAVNSTGVSPTLAQRGFSAAGMTNAPHPPAAFSSGAQPGYANQFDGHQVAQPAMQLRQAALPVAAPAPRPAAPSRAKCAPHARC